jgi:hypothetical protein
MTAGLCRMLIASVFRGRLAALAPGRIVSGTVYRFIVQPEPMELVPSLPGYCPSKPGTRGRMCSIYP